jgi:hypothetical protein
MDDVIGSYPCTQFGELNWCHDHGLLYQRDVTVSVEYGKEYFQHYVELEDTDVALKLNQGRVALSHKYCDVILDMGVGSGEFIKKSWATMYGFDINPVGVAWLKERGIWADPYADMPGDVRGVTLWDTLEHIPKPSDLLRRIRQGQYVFVSLPVFTDLSKVRFSKHYKPGEHLFYWTTGGLIKYFGHMGFDCLEVSDHEMLAGRQDIMAFAFKKTR